MQFIDLASFSPARLWDRLDPLSRAVVTLGLMALLGPFGEMVDVALIAEFEADLIAFDFGLDAVATVLLPVYYVALLLLAIAAAGRGLAEYSCSRPVVIRRPISRHPSPPQPVPIL